MDTGGLAQMTYNGSYYANPGSFSAPAAGYGSRGKSAHMKRLSVAPSANIGSIDEDQIDIVNPTPRTSRSHLLAGLRTAPRQTANVPSSAPYNQQRFGSDGSSFAGRNNMRSGQIVPQTATASHFPYMPMQQQQQQYGYPGDVHQKMYCLPEQVLAPPDLNLANDNLNSMDPELFNALMQQNAYLAQRQQQLQQQLLATANQMQALNLNNGYHAPATPITPQMSVYSQQAQNGVQPIVQAIPNQPGVYSVYNPMTGQHTIFYDQDQMLPSPPVSGNPGLVSSSPELEGPTRNVQRETMSSPFGHRFNGPRTSSPPKGSPSPQQDVTPLPPPSANAFRPGHRKSMSSAVGAAAAKALNLDGPKTADVRTSAFPRTPMTGTFGPGMARAGEHPVRQPRGPPPLDDLVANPTAKHEGSKNFATRQRRRAVHDLVRAGKERTIRGGSSDMGTPTSEGEISFLISSDADSEGGMSSASGSGSLSGDPTFGTFKASSAIGSERKGSKDQTRERNSFSRSYSPTYRVTDGGLSVANQPRDFAAAVKATEVHSPALNERRRSPLLALASAAEKRKSYK